MNPNINTDSTENKSRHPVISLRNVGKTFHPGARRATSVKDSLFQAFSPARRSQAVEALSGVNLEIARGESVGIVGANGSGKSTLLKLIAGITQPSEGEIEIGGRVLGLIELGAGFHPELSGEENVRLQGAIHELSASQTARMADSIFEYAGLDDFRTTPLKHYSSGMKVRLGFAVAVQCDPEILLVDEVLSVGDATFQQKCLREIEAMRARGVTIVLVTHQMEFAERVCERLVWLKDGRIYDQGPAPEVLERFHVERITRQFPRPEGPLTRERIAVNLPGRFGTGEARIVDIHTVGADGRARRNFLPGEPLGIRIRYEADPEVEAIDCALVIDYEEGSSMAFWRAEEAGALQRPRDGRGSFCLWIDDPPFLPGRYTYTPALTRPGGTDNHYDLHLRAYHFSVIAENEWLPSAPLRLCPAARWT